jgi:hypothetical protein
VCAAEEGPSPRFVGSPARSPAVFNAWGGGHLPLALFYRALLREGVFSGPVFYACLLLALAGLVSSTAITFLTVLVKFSPLFYPCSRVRAAGFF